jgi:hypothetical protein
MQADGLVTIRHDNHKSYFKHLVKPHKYSQQPLDTDIRGGFECQHPLQPSNWNHLAAFYRCSLH